MMKERCNLELDNQSSRYIVIQENTYYRNKPTNKPPWWNEYPMTEYNIQQPYMSVEMKMNDLNQFNRWQHWRTHSTVS